MKIILLLLSDFTHSSVFRKIMVTIGVLVGLWVLLVPLTYIVSNVYPHIPVVNQIYGEPLVLTNTYAEIFQESYSSISSFGIAILLSVFMLIVVLAPFVLVGIVLYLLVIIIAMFYNSYYWVRYGSKYTIRKIKYYFRDLKFRARER